MVEVSIIIITYNEEKNIKDCLDSLINQDFKNFEVIIPDHSNDKTKEIILNYKNNFKNIKYIYSKEAGFSVQRNIGIQNANGKYIAFIDADCIAPKDWLNNLINSFKLFNKEDNVAGVGGNAFSPPNSPYLGKMIACLGFPAGGDIGLDANTKINGKFTEGMATCNAIFLKEKLIEIKGFNENLKYGGEDTDLCKKLLSNGYKLGYVKDSFVYHKTRDSLTDYINWNIRRGKADFHIHKKSLAKYVFDPFSIITLIIYIELCIASIFINPKTTMYFILISYISFNILTIFGAKKFRLLFMRQRKIKISLFSLFFVIPFLTYLRKFLMNYQGLKARLCPDEI